MWKNKKEAQPKPVEDAKPQVVEVTDKSEALAPVDAVTMADLPREDPRYVQVDINDPAHGNLTDAERQKLA